MYVLFSFLPLWPQTPSGLRWFILQAMDAARLTTAQFTLLLAHDLLRTSLCLFPLSSMLVRDCSSRAGEGRPRWSGYRGQAGRQLGRHHRSASASSQFKSSCREEVLYLATMEALTTWEWRFSSSFQCLFHRSSKNPILYMDTVSF